MTRIATRTALFAGTVLTGFATALVLSTVGASPALQTAQLPELPPVVVTGKVTRTVAELPRVVVTGHVTRTVAELPRVVVTGQRSGAPARSWIAQAGRIAANGV